MTGFLFKKTAVAGVGYRQYPRGTADLPERFWYEPLSTPVMMPDLIRLTSTASCPMATIIMNPSG